MVLYFNGEKEMSYELKRYHMENGGNKIVILNDHGRKWIHVLMMDGGLVVKKIPAIDTQYMSDLPRTKSMKAIVRQFRSYGKRTGMTKAAKSFLCEANKAA